MGEDIKNMSKEELLEYLEDISQQLDNIALDQIQFAISELQFFKEEYKKLEEENKELQTVVDSIRYLNNGLRADKEALTNLVNELQKQIRNSIPTSVIQNKIDENNKLIEQCLEDEEHYGEIFLYKHDNEVLQEILEEGRK